MIVTSRVFRLSKQFLGGLSSGSLGQISVTLAGIGSIYCLNIGTGIIVARVLGPHGRGIATAIGLWQPAIAALVTLGLPTAVNIAIQKSPLRRGAITIVAAKISFLSGAVAAMIGALLLPFALTHYSQQEIHFAQATLCLVPMALLFGTSLSSLQAQQRFFAFNVLRTTPQVLTLTLLVMLTLLQKLNPFSANLSYMLPVLITAPLTLFLSRPSAAKISSPIARELLHYGFRSYGTEIVSGLGGSVDKLLIIILLAPTTVGLYLVGRSLADVLMGLQQSVAIVLLSRAAGSSSPSVIAMTSLAARVGAAITLIGGVLIGSVAGWLLPFVYGGGFEHSAAIFRILVTDVVFTGLSITLGQAFHTIGRPGVMSTIQLGITALTIPVVMLGAGVAGGYGVALAMGVVAILRLGAVMTGYRLIIKTEAPRLIINRQDIQNLLSRFGITSINVGSEL